MFAPRLIAHGFFSIIAFEPYLENEKTNKWKKIVWFEPSESEDDDGNSLQFQYEIWNYLQKSKFGKNTKWASMTKAANKNNITSGNIVDYLPGIGDVVISIHVGSMFFDQRIITQLSTSLYIIDKCKNRVLCEQVTTTTDDPLIVLLSSTEDIIAKFLKRKLE
ncbi:MAG: hypothetical protein NT007_11420 [Candidatus Kapabacteria bacterium]|nr:hypothetical protein [Candidatus Kapabacteria bacterium]